MNRRYTAETPWSPARPQTLVVCCSDGRWHAQMMEFVRREVSDRADLYAVPGGPAVLDGWNSSFDESRAVEQALRMFAEHHDIEGVWLIAHEGCAYYRMKHPHLDPAEIRRRQAQDLRRAREVILERHPRYEVRLVFAHLCDDRVVFAAAQDATEEAEA